MERKCQNLEFTTKLSATKKEDFERPLLHHKCLIIPKEPLTDSSSAVTVKSDLLIPPCNSNNSAFEHMDYNLLHDNDNYNNVDVENENAKEMQTDEDYSDIECSVKQQKLSSKLKAELSKYKKELRDYTNTTKNLEQKYLKINYELNEMQDKHKRFVAKHRGNSVETETSSDVSSTGSEYSLRRKNTQIFHRDKSYYNVMDGDSISMLDYDSNAEYHSNKTRHSHGGGENYPIDGSARRKQRHMMDNKENEFISKEFCSKYMRKHERGLKDIYKTLKNVIDNNQCFTTKACNKAADVGYLQNTIANLQNEQERYRTIIEQQQSCLHDYHTRCVKAQHIMQTQQIEIEKLNSNNHQLESEITSGIDQLRLKIEAKLREVAQLPQMMREQQCKHERVVKENNMLSERIRSIQAEATQLKVKIEEIGKRKIATLTRLKAAERDLKIFKNYNAALKHEKRKLSEELQKMRDQMDNMQNSSKRSMNRQREQNEKQRRELQKRVFELEMKLTRSKNSTTNLLQERDSLIAELQSQLNTLVHNFEVSQKHIRVLRRHIYSMSGGAIRDVPGARNQISNELKQALI